MSFHVRFRFRRLAMLTMTVAAFVSMAMATPTTITWNDAGPVFATGTNWTGGLVPGSGDIVEFSTTDPIHNQPVIGAATSVAGLVFGNGAGAFTLSGAGPLTIGDSGITNCSTTIGQTIAVPLILAGSGYQWIKNDGTLTISSAITNDTGSGLKLAGPGTGGTVSGVISGTKDVIKYDGGTWTLSGANTFTGKLLVEDGVLNLAGTTVTPRVEVSGGATLNLDAANTLAATAEVYVYGLGTLKVKQSQTVATLESGTSGAQASVVVDSGALLTINAPNDNVETFEGVISGAGSVAKTGLGRQIFSGANTYTGTTTIASGTLEVTQLANGGTASGLGASAAGAGNLVLNGGTLRYSGATDVSTDRLFTLGANGGAIDTTNGGALSFSSTGNIGFGTANVNVTLTLNSGSAVTNTFNPVLTDNGTGKTAVTKNGQGTWVLGSANTFTGATDIAYGTLSLGHSQALQSSAVTVGATGDLAFHGITAATLGSLAGTKDIALQNDAATPAAVALTVGGNNTGTSYSGVLSAAGSLTKAGTGTFTLGAANTYTGGTTVSQGKLVVTNTSGSGTGTGAVTVSGGATLQIGDGATNDAGAISGNMIDNGAVTFNRPGTGGYTYAGVISGGGAATFGAGTTTLTGASTYNGGTTVGTGAVLVLGNTSGATLATGADVTLNGTGELHVDQNQTTRAVKGDSTSKVVIAASKALTINLPDASDPTHTAATYEGTISGDGSLVIGGPGTFTLTGTNDYSGGTVLNSGTLVASSDAALGATGGQVSSGTLRGGRGVGGVRALSVGEGGKQALGGTPTGGLTFNGGALRAGSGFTSERVITLGANGGTVDTNTYQLTLSGMITGAGKLTHQGTGVLTLSGSNDYSGGTKVKGGGVLDFTANDNLGAGGVELDNGFLRTRAAIADFTHDLLLAAGGGNLNSYGFDSTFSGKITGTGGLTVQSQTGNGVLTLTGASQYAGATSVQSGTLKVGADDALPMDNSVSVSGGATLDLSANQSLKALSGAGTIQVASGKLLTLKDQALFGSVISGAGGVKFENSNSVNGLTTLTASQTYTGTTTVSIGKLQLGNAASAVTLAGPVSTGSGTTLIFSHGSGNSTMSQAISGSGSVAKNNSGTLTLSGTNTYTGSTTVNGGTLKATATGALPSTTGLSLGTGAALNVAANQTINRFLTTDTTSSILLEAGQMLTVALGGNPGAGTQFNGTISGAGGLKISDAGGFTVALTGDNTYTGGTTIDANAGLWIGSGGTKGLIAGNVVNNGTLLFARADKVTFGGVISGSGVVKQTVGSGTLEFTAANTYSGGTMLYAWLLAKNSSGSATGTGSVAVYSGGMLGGNGTISGPVSINSGGTVGPGTALGIPAELHVGNTTFASGGVFAFQIKDATGSAGSDYSLLSSSGALTISATSGNPFTISVYSVNGSTQGTTANFDSTVGYSWTFVSAANGITGFDAAAFQVSTANFQNAFTGSFGISQAGNSLLLNYTPAAVPEPATWALLGLGLGGVWWWRRQGGRAGSGR